MVRGVAAAGNNAAAVSEHLHRPAGADRPERAEPQSGRSRSARRARAPPHRRHQSHARLLRRRARLRRDLRGSRRARLGHDRRHPVRLAPAATTTTSASTRGSRRAGDPQPDGVTGLHHVALRYSSRAHLADALRRLQTGDWPLRQLIDHGTHEAIYLADPDGNDLELCWDRPLERVAARRARAIGSWTATSTSTACSPSRRPGTDASGPRASRTRRRPCRSRSLSRPARRSLRRAMRDRSPLPRCCRRTSSRGSFGWSSRD